jgi:hypothetical protein
MPKKLVIVTNCSERKRGRARALHLSELQDTLGEKARRWCRRLENRHGERVTALDLYQGDHWTAVLSLIRKAELAGWETDLWVASAGYGLIPAHAPLSPYAATFGGYHSDSVARDSGYLPKDAGQKWWKALARWAGPVPGSPRTLEALAGEDPKAAWLVVMSPTYLDAISVDLMAARSELTSASRLAIVSGTPGPTELELVPHWIPALEVCRGTLGGSCTSLNARIGGHLVSNYPPREWNCKRMQPDMNLWMAGLQPLERPNRRPITDAEALTYIRKAVRSNPLTSHSALLRILRSQGVACEQKRFRDLFHSLETKI